MIISPRVNLEINGNVGEYEVGDKLYALDKIGEKFLYVGYIGTTDNGKMFLVPVASPAKTSEDFKKTYVYKSLPGAVKRITWKSGNVVTDGAKSFLNNFGTGLTALEEWIRTGAVPVGFIYEDGTFVNWPEPVAIWKNAF